MSKRSRVISYGSAGLLVVVGIVLGVVIGGTVGQVLALFVVGLGLVLAVALVFFEVGLSEDRERAQEEAARAEAEAQKRGHEEPQAPRRPRRRVYLERRRGQRRKLD